MNAAEPPQDDDLPGMLAVAKGVAEQRWPHTMDAKVWAEEFYKCGLRVWHEPGGVEPDQQGLMLGWFANAIMAGYDTAQQRTANAEPPQDVAQLPDRSKNRTVRASFDMKVIVDEWGGSVDLAFQNLSDSYDDALDALAAMERERDDAYMRRHTVCQLLQILILAQLLSG